MGKVIRYSQKKQAVIKALAKKSGIIHSKKQPSNVTSNEAAQFVKIFFTHTKPDTKDEMTSCKNGTKNIRESTTSSCFCENSPDFLLSYQCLPWWIVPNFVAFTQKMYCYWNIPLQINVNVKFMNIFLLNWRLFQFCMIPVYFETLFYALISQIHNFGKGTVRILEIANKW